MALPKLNSGPKYQLEIPSSKQTIKYRPFLMKEEKSLLIAMESQDNTVILNTLIDTIKQCVDDEIRTDKLTSFDVEYMFLQIRSKSVGETADIGMNCSHCGNTNKIAVNLDDIKIEVPDVEKTIVLDENISLEVDYPSFHDLINSGIMSSTGTANTEQMFALMNYCFKSIITEDQKIKVSEVSKTELTEFIDSMNANQFTKIREFIESIPKLEHTIEFTCSHCKEENKQVVEGIANFLS